MSVLLRLPQVTNTAGSRIPIDFTAVKAKGPGGGWLVVDTVRIAYSIPVTVSTADLLGADQWRAAGRIQMKDAGNSEFYNLLGDQVRVAGHHEHGDLSEGDPSAISAGAGTIAIVVRIPVTPHNRMAKRHRDFGLSIAGWKNSGEELVITCASDGDLTAGSSTSVIGATGTINVTLECHEEAKPEFKFRSVWRSTKPKTDLDFSFPCVGLLRYGILHGRAASGGVAISTITDVTMPSYSWDNVPRATIVNVYQRSRQISSVDVVVTGARALPIVAPMPGQKATELRTFEGVCPVTLTGTYTGFDVITNVLEPMGRAAGNEQAERQGVRDFKIATAAKTKTTPSVTMWGALMVALMPKKAKAAPQPAPARGAR